MAEPLINKDFKKYVLQISECNKMKGSDGHRHAIGFEKSLVITFCLYQL